MNSIRVSLRFRESVDPLVRLCQVAGGKLHTVGQVAELRQRDIAGFEIAGGGGRYRVDFAAHGVERVM